METPENKDNLEYIEFETKYRVEGHLLTEFKKLIDMLPDKKSFLYVEGPDYYYTKDDLEEGFARYRKPSHGLDGGRCEVTYKMKLKDAKNNIMRKEYNWRVDKTPEETIKATLTALGFKHNFSIWKSCHIYKLADATLVLYTVYDITDGKPSKNDNFVEIEVDEESVHKMQEADAWEVIKKYEAILAPLGINPQKRLRKSLFEMYRRG